jgi:hypothetical protein
MLVARASFGRKILAANVIVFMFMTTERCGNMRLVIAHQGIDNRLIEPPESLPKVGRIRCQNNSAGCSTTTIRRRRDAPILEVGRVSWQYKVSLAIATTPS